MNLNFLECLQVLSIGAVFFLFACTPSSDTSFSADKEIQIESGKITGTAGQNPDIKVYKGIPFAAPPIGDLRWKAPQPPVSWEGVLAANEFCKSCIQNLTREYGPWTNEYMIANDVSEDCLALNIWTPASTVEDKLPVLVYIHGGAFTGGSGEVLLYNGEGLAEKGIVVVTINYRVGIMGFFSHPELTKESSNNASGNYGLLDQVAALEWVKKNISQFGGDANNVTISGQSAGAYSIHLLTASPLAKGLFHKAIAQSGPWSGNRTNTTLEDYEEMGKEFADTLGGMTLAELRAMDAVEVHDKSNELGFRFRPVIDGWFFPENIKTIYEKGNQNDVPMISGFNADEGSSRSTYGKMTAEQFEAMGKNYYAEKFELFSKFYSAGTEEEVSRTQLEQSRDAGMANLLRWSLIRDQTGTSKSYKYFFERPTPWPEHPEYQTFHSSEIPYVFRNQHLIDRPWEPIDKELSELMSDYWVNFITSGDPNGEGLATWPSEADQMMRFGENSKTDQILNTEKQEFYDIVENPSI